MKAEDIDKIWKEKMDSLYEHPTGIQWNKNMGWRSYRLNQKKLKKKDNYLAYYIAAGLAIMVTLSAIFINVSSNKIGLQTITITENTNENKEIKLPNNHICTLRQGSSLTFITGKTSNPDTIYLNGEAFFELSDKSKVVIVAKNAVITCHSASLNIRNLSNEQNVIVTSIKGEAYVSQNVNKDIALILLPNEKSTIHQSNLLIYKEPNDDTNFLAWKTGELVFNNIPLNVVAKTISDYYHVTISFEGNSVKYCRFSSTFKQNSIDEVLKNIQTSLNATVIKNNNNILLAGGDCK
jgi:transmembrane sensor